MQRSKMSLFMMEVFLIIVVCSVGCYSAPTSGTDNVLGELKASVHVVEEVSLNRNFRNSYSSSQKSLIFDTLKKINELNQHHEELVSEISQLREENAAIDVGTRALQTVLMEMLRDGCNWAKSTFNSESLNCSNPKQSLHRINLMANVYQSAQSLYGTLGKYRPQPVEEYEEWVKTRIFCDSSVTDNVTRFVLDNHTPFLKLRGKKRTDMC